MDIKIMQQMLQNQAMSALDGKINQTDNREQFSAPFQQLLNGQIAEQLTADKKPENLLNRAGNQQTMSGDVQQKIPSDRSTSDFDTYIKNSSEKYGVDESLIHAVINAESGYTPDARSSAGAQGMMQLMPATAKGLGVENPHDPEQNIDGGTKYLRHMLDKYNGNIEIALAAYNAGPGNIEDYQGIPPFEETTNYIQNVIEDYRG